MGAWIVLYDDDTVRVVGRSEAEAAARELRRSRGPHAVITDVVAIATIVDDEVEV
jgi:hypothetical protein